MGSQHISDRQPQRRNNVPTSEYCGSRRGELSNTGHKRSNCVSIPHHIKEETQLKDLWTLLQLLRRMEALAAVSLAGTAAQFLEYAISAARLAFQITGDAEPEQRLAIATTVRDVRESLSLLKETKDQNSGPTRDATLQALVAGCLDVATEIDAVVNNLDDKGKGAWKFVEGFQKTGYLLYKGKDLQRLSERLFKLRSEVSAHLIVLIEQQQRGIQETLLSFSATHNAYQEQFGKHLDSSLNYLKSISERIDFLTVSSEKGAGGALHIASAEAINDISFQEERERTAYMFYSQNHDFLYQNLSTLAGTKQRLILQTLSFAQIHEREYTIPEAHRLTFEWMLKSAASDASFEKWLRSTTGIFWVCGKAGSGKSTLMKFLADHTTTHKKLGEWADPNSYGVLPPVIVAKHYFWSIGTPMQKSQEGLMRSVLLQIFSQRSELIQHICAERWAAPYAESFYPWTRTRLTSAMALLGKTNVKICLFIDGLDEYGGDQGELVALLLSLSKSPNIKICVSSRPWLDFTDAFDASPWKIRLEDLTKPDIHSYVTDLLGRNPRFQKLQTSHKHNALNFIQTITSKSEGVFLWVYLVVRSLLRGLRNADDLNMLQTRLDALPSDLEDYFKRMLETIEDVYRPRTARLFLTLCYARSSFPVLTFFFFELDDNTQSSELDPLRAQQEPLEFLSSWPNVDTGHFEALITKKRQLVAQCKDMIHISSDPKAHVLFGERVGFLHRTIVDFIQTNNVFKRLESLGGTSFDPRRLLFDANLGQTRSLIHLHRLTYIRSYLSQWILGCLFYAYELEATAPNPDHCIPISIALDELEAIMLRGFARWDFHHAMQTLFQRDDFVSFLDLAARCDLKAYVQWKHPGFVSATFLDEYALGWRSPCRLQRGADCDFEIVQQEEKELDSWRLGSCIDVPTVLPATAAVPASLGAPPMQLLVDGLQQSDVGAQNRRRSKFWRKLTDAFH